MDTTTKKLEYDSAVGGSVVLESHVQTFRYAASATQEIRELLAAIHNPTSTKLVFQTLPKHMRRRAMSHHPKRLPRKYRFAHRAQMAKAGNPQPTKRPSRRHRRRPQNLLCEYLRRQRRHIWLETHIWHARRFHMIDRWGYRLPYASCDKTYRSCFRASAEHCLLQDISFMVCLQLEGRLNELRTGFARVTSAKCGLSITAKTFLSGRREGSIEIFRDGQYPYNALGKISFIWRPLDDGDSEQRTIWLWVHPTAYAAVLEELKTVFELVSTKSVKVEIKSDGSNVSLVEKEDDIQTEDNGKDNKADKTKKPFKSTSAKTQRKLQFMTKTCAFERIKCYTNSVQTLKLSDLKDTMNRFRLTGPLSQCVLTQAFKSYKVPNVETANKHWFYKCAEHKSFQQQHEIQTTYWQQNCQQLTSPAQLMSNMIIALNIDDPRIHRPVKRTKASLAVCENYIQDYSNVSDALIDVPQELPHSALWNAELRNHICEQMLSTQQYCELRAKHAVVPGDRCMFESEMQPVPLLLIQRPGSQQPQYKRLGYGCGWDVIAPAGYGMPIWMALIMWGSKPGGLREFDSVARETGTEQHQADTLGGQQIAAERYTELRRKYFRLPPNKRCNYVKLAIASPFRAPFKQLVRDWLPENVNNEKSTFHVLRDRKLLQEINVGILGKEKYVPCSIPTDCLIQIELRMKSRGNLDDNALICLPTRSDLKRNFKQIRHENHEPVYTEPKMEDLNEKERKELRIQHKKLLKRMRARRVREKRKKQETSNTRVYIRAADTAHLVAAQYEKMCKLWLPEDFDTFLTVRKQCTREVFGYVSNAKFSYTEATVCAVAYITAGGLKELLNVCKTTHLRQPMFLVRGTKTRQYRFASFKINLEI